MASSAEELEELAGLTPALKRELATLSETPQDKSVTWSERFGYRLERLGLAKRTLLSDRTYLTPLGLRAQAAIAREKQG